MSREPAEHRHQGILSFDRFDFRSTGSRAGVYEGKHRRTKRAREKVARLKFNKGDNFAVCIARFRADDNRRLQTAARGNRRPALSADREENDERSGDSRFRAVVNRSPNDPAAYRDRCSQIKSTVCR